MSANRRRHINALPGLKLLMGFSAGAILLITGLGYVYCQNELHRLLGEAGKLERDYNQLRFLCEGVQVNIAKMSSQTELQKKRENGFFAMKEIDPKLIIRVTPGPEAAVSAVRPASMGKAAK